MIKKVVPNEDLGGSTPSGVLPGGSGFRRAGTKVFGKKIAIIHMEEKCFINQQGIISKRFLMELQ
jgi:hypothetical protein